MTNCGTGSLALSATRLAATPLIADMATQRIIIDLGLSTETIADHARVLMGMSDTHMRRRVVGKWERA